MRRICRKKHDACDRVAAVIELLISCNPQGFNILLGKTPPPTPREIHEMMNAIRFPMPDDFKPTMPNNETEAERIVYDTDYFNKAIAMAGGWARIAKAVRSIKKSSPRVWRVVVDYEKFVQSPIERYKSKLGFVANRNGIGVNTVLRYRRNFAYKLAYVCLLPSEDDEDFSLVSLPDFENI